MDFSHGTISVSLSTILFVASYLFHHFRQIKQQCRTTRLSGRENLTPMVTCKLSHSVILLVSIISKHERRNQKLRIQPIAADSTFAFENGQEAGLLADFMAAY